MAKRTKRPQPAEKALSAAARRRRRSKRKYTLYYLLALVLVLAAGCILSMTVFFRIETVAVQGNTRYADGELIAAADISTGDNLLRLNAKRIAQTLIDRYPYIAGVRVRRILPTEVVLEIDQATPQASIETTAGYLLTDAGGRILEDGLPVCPDGSPRAVGFSVDGMHAGDYLTGEESDRFAVLCELTDAMRELDLRQINVIDLGDLLNLHLLYDGRIAIALGSRLDLSYKLRSAKNVLDTAVNADTVGLLDVSVRPVARLREINIYDPEHWPLPDGLLEDYERAIVKESLPQPQAEPQASEPALLQPETASEHSPSSGGL